MTLSRALSVLAAALCCCATGPIAARMPEARTAGLPAQKLDHYPIKPGVDMFSGPGGNTLVFTGEDGVMVIDPGPLATSAALLEQIVKLSPEKPIRWVIDTGSNPQHVAANQAVAAAGQTLEGGNTRPTAAVGATGGAPIWAHEGVVNRLAADGTPGVPTNSYFVTSKDMWVNGQAVQILSASPGSEEGNSFVYLRMSEVIASGDVYAPDRYPAIDLEHGGSVKGVIDGLNKLLRYAVPEFNQEGGTIVVPGHGRISDEADVALYRDMVTIIHDRIQDMVTRKMTLEQVQSARPTFDYDSVYGAAEGRAFTSLVYRSLTEKPATNGGASR